MNKYGKTLMIYAEDDATKQLADSFFDFLVDYEFNRKWVRVKMYRGWSSAVDAAIKDDSLKNHDKRKGVILIDLDKSNTRISDIKKKIAEESCEDKIFVVGWKGNIEQFKADLGYSGIRFQKFGERLAEDYLKPDCLENTDNIWQNYRFDDIKKDYGTLRELLNIIKN